MMLEMAVAAADLDFGSALCRSARTGRTLDVRRAASSGSVGGLTGFEMGSLRRAARLRRDLAIVCICVQTVWCASTLAAE